MRVSGSGASTLNGILGRDSVVKASYSIFTFSTEEFNSTHGRLQTKVLPTPMHDAWRAVLFSQKDTPF